MLSESSQTQKATYCLILFIERSRKSKHSRNGGQINGCQESGVELRESVNIQPRRVSSWGGKTCFWMVVVVTYLYAFVKTHAAVHQKQCLLKFEKFF